MENILNKLVYCTTKVVFTSKYNFNLFNCGKRNSSQTTAFGRPNDVWLLQTNIEVNLNIYKKN